MYTETPLTPRQEQTWENTMSMMMYTCPGYRHLFMKLLAEKANAGQTKYAAIFRKDISNACTDGKNIMINPDWFFAMTIPEQVFVLYHEIQHNVYNDVWFLRNCALSGKVPMNDGTTLPFDEATMQKSMDFRINALGIDAHIGEPPKEGNFDKGTNSHDGLVDVYKKHYKKKPDSGQGNAPGGNPGGFDVVLPPGKSTGQSPSQVQPRNDQQWAVELAAAKQLEQNSIKNQGHLPADMLRMFDELLSPEVPWTEHIKSEFERKTGSGTKTWKRPDRRFIGRDMYLPSKSGFSCGHIVIYGDTSGSISNDDITRYISEFGAIIEDVKPKRLTVLWGDTRVAHIDELEDTSDLQNLKPKGGGGSDSRPFFDWLNEQDETPEVFIGFTDGYISFPDHEPKCEVIWASTTKDREYPFGTVVHINPKGVQP